MWNLHKASMAEVVLHKLPLLVACRGSLSINFITGESQLSPDSLSTAFKWHGALLALSFGLFMPLAILIARLFLADSQRTRVPLAEPLNSASLVVTVFTRPYLHRPFWFRTHQAVQLLAVLTSVVAVVVPFAATGTRGLKWTHGVLGLVVLALVLLQPILGFLRPKKESQVRRAWYAAHWLIGLTAVGLAWLNIKLGLELYEMLFSQALQQVSKNFA